jgi:hypothetical protein
MRYDSTRGASLMLRSKVPSGHDLTAPRCRILWPGTPLYRNHITRAPKYSIEHKVVFGGSP